jgi:hypothetical protein
MVLKAFEIFFFFFFAQMGKCREPDGFKGDIHAGVAQLRPMHAPGTGIGSFCPRRSGSPSDFLLARRSAVCQGEEMYNNGREVVVEGKKRTMSTVR